MENEEKWTVEIHSSPRIFDLNLKEIWRYRDLLWLFVRRDFVTVYKQTILGPIWYIVQAVLTTLMFVLVFGRIAKLSTDGAPQILFYLLGVTIWGYFSECLNRTSNTFVTNQHIFGKVYFPRFTVPGSIVISTLVRFGIQFSIFLVFLVYYYVRGEVQISAISLLLPFILGILALMSLGIGMIFSSLSTKYRDFQFLLSFAIQLWMYATPIIYPLSSIPVEYVKYIKMNPVTPLVEVMRFGFLGQGTYSLADIGYSFVTAMVVFLFGLLIFSRVEKSFMDTV